MTEPRWSCDFASNKGPDSIWMGILNAGAPIDVLCGFVRSALVGTLALAFAPCERPQETAVQRS
jgi:hypothetical protein